MGLVLAACGGSTGNDRDSGANKTYLSVEASDADGGDLQYQWRVTGGSIENRNSRETVWTMPDGPGLHFAYVRVSDGRGGYAEQQYAVSTDALLTEVPARPQRVHTPPTVTDVDDGALLRLRVVSATDTQFLDAGGTRKPRLVYTPDVRVRVTQVGSGALAFAGTTDLGGEVYLPKLPRNASYLVECASTEEGPLAPCATSGAAATISIGASATRLADFNPGADTARNLRLFGHVALADGAVCGAQSDFFDVLSAATVSVQTDTGTALSRPVRVNRFGDYAIDVAVPARAATLKLRVQCEGYSATVAIPPAAAAAGYDSANPVEVSHTIANQGPRIVKVVAQGPDGNLRGRSVVIDTGPALRVTGNADHFLTYKGKDTKLSSCLYYRALGAVKDCDAQGNMVEPISFDDWKRQNQLPPFAAGNAVFAADYINKMDLNLVRRMVATKLADDRIAFSVCNHPGPEGSSQREIDQVMDTAFVGERLVACVTMEWSSTPGMNGGRPFTKFFTFAPDGSLLASVNLDGRGEKYLPGTCVACHGGRQYNGRFPENRSLNPSAHVGSGFLPFDTGNYDFSTQPGKTEAAQGEQIYRLNELVTQIETARAAQAVVPETSAMVALFEGWYAGRGFAQNKAYVPPVWASAESTRPGASKLYREVLGAACRTCHVALGPSFNWDTEIPNKLVTTPVVCGGGPDVARNATMPNALISRDRVAERIAADGQLATLVIDFLGCSTPLPDPVYPKR